MNRVRVQDVRAFWEAHPLCASAIPYSPGEREYFEYYDRLREANESLSFSYWLHEYRRFAGKRVLDVGCGNGYVLSKYAREEAEVFGVDLTQTGVELCRRRFAYLGLRSHFQVANAEALPFHSRTFDCVCSMGVLHHTPDPGKAIGEIARVLKKGGRLVVMFYHRNSALYRVSFPLRRLLTGKTLQQLVNEVDGVGNPKGDVYSKAELRRLLQPFAETELFAGLLRGSMILPVVGRFIPDRLLRPFEPRWGWFLYARAIKPI